MLCLNSREANMDNEIGCFELYRKLLPESFFQEINEPGKRGGIFSVALVAFPIPILKEVLCHESTNDSLLNAK